MRHFLTVVGTQLGTSNRDTRIMSVRVGQRQGRSVPRALVDRASHDLPAVLRRVSASAR